METFASRLKDLRLTCNYSQSTLARKIGVSQKAIDLWERGQSEPKLSYIVALAKHFNVTTDYLVGLED